ncbi:DNA polymerase III subunit gamma/tau [Plesiomonas shigelloides]|uniref:DNA polymerase III subunit gamma/tau n=1 Tax=Plesiomonas shigelloides TaxID=703 RepID=UPI000D11D62F|nr:DNA polymerase III subunit gamma/tau [Plesiomonas shigelloides]AVQ85883.1 DNA polymerase III subunit gamma/tau [Plesiomonas shigelloides]
MSYQVLARKWRPHNFAEVVGQEHVLTALANGLSLGRLHHAYLFSGTRGVGKTSIARLFAKGLNCETGITATPCGVCETCREIDEGRFVDLLEIDAASRTKIEDTRELLDNVQYTPVRGRFKVYLIDEVHMLSRHSFNALLKTLEEPPEYVKFLLATTDPQKLPVTILSRCLQFHLKALDPDQIRAQLEKVLTAEAIPFEARALLQLARAAEGSMRDALSLADQAIAMGGGDVTATGVSHMLGTLDADQPLALVEALHRGDAEQVMLLLQQAAERGTDWEALLVETSAILHRVAMAQLLPGTLEEADPYAVRLRELARTVSPQDIQLFYQTLLVGRKELLLAPDRRSGTEMTFLRALAFHPKKVSAPVASGSFDAMAAAGQSPSRAPVSNGAPTHTAPTNTAPAHHAAPVNTAAMPAASVMQSGQMPAQAPMQMQQAHMPPSQAPSHAAAGRVAPSMPPAVASAAIEPNAAAPAPIGDSAPVGGFPAGSADSPALQALQARAQLRRQRHAEPSAGEGTSTKKATPVAAAVTLRPAGNKPSPLERLAAAGEQRVRPSAGPRTADRAVSSKAKKPEAYRWKPVNPVEEAPEVVTPDVVRSSLEHEKTPEMALKLAQEACERDSWSAQIEKLNVAKLVEQLALNAVKEEPAPGQVRLLLRSSQRHLNTDRAKEQLSEALSQLAGAPVTLEIIENDDKTRLTPLEIRQAIYDEKLAQARQSLQDDKNILQLRRLFGADLEDDSIRPL